ncbi:hypothetical protein I9W82_001653 [Candida metapsilosis]|uniref:Uncharacterized protein n=1 Tax=Candida metapsilosis TaxID=273372 RepID=A0A8H7ZDE0_9ASCO|nr:hypothetical protein I9W82_001653 [Candida metapsilosis]
MSLPLTRDSIELNDLEKSSSSSTSAYKPNNDNYHLDPSSKHILKRLYFALVIQTMISCSIYYQYQKISEINQMLAPTLLGCFSGGLAQSINQFSRKKFKFNKIIEFMIWGSINGYFTVSWINLLMQRFENIVYRILVDQAIGAPTFQLIFNILNALWDHGEVFTKATRNAYFKSLKYSYCYWPFFSVFSFVFIPQSMMFPCNCLANLIWNLILSRLA